MSCGNPLRTSPAKDAGATGGATSDASGSTDSPTNTSAGTGGVIMPGTGGAPNTGGMSGSRFDGSATGGTVADGNVTGAGGDYLCWPSPGYDDAGWPCGSYSISTSRRLNDVLLVLDRSGSMQKSLVEDCLCTDGAGNEGGSSCSATTTCADRWTTVKSIVGQMIASASGVEWGVELFPSPLAASCSVSPAPQWPVSVDGGVPAQLDAITPGGNTPTAAAVSAATAYLSALADQNKKVMVLVTDGEPNCAAGQASATSSDTEATLAAITAAFSAGFPVYVIGVGPSVGNLDDMAKAGGTVGYYPATSPELLSDALSAISKMVASCTFVLPGTPTDPNNVAVYINKQRMERDSVNGWAYGATTSTIVLTGAYCESLMTALDTTVQILFGCSGLAPPPCLP